MKKTLLKYLFSVLLLLVLAACGGGEKEDNERTGKYDMYEDVVLEDVRASDGLDAQYIITGSYSESITYPMVTWINSQESLDAYCEEYKDVFYLEDRLGTDIYSTIGFLEACDRYDEAFWAEKDVILVVLSEGDGMCRHVVVGLTESEEGKWIVAVRRLNSIMHTAEMVEWHLMIEVPKGQITETDQFEVRVGDVQVGEIIYATEEATTEAE